MKKKPVQVNALKVQSKRFRVLYARNSQVKKETTIKLLLFQNISRV